MEPFFVEAGGCRLEAGIWRCPAPRTQGGMLLVPGFWGDFKRPAFTGICESLAQLGPAAAVNLRGHGRSSGIFTFGDREAGDMAYVFKAMEERGMLPLRVIGFSMGGWVLARFLAARPEWREKTAHLVLAGVPSRLPWVLPKPWLPGLWVQLLRGGKGIVRPNLVSMMKARDLLADAGSLAGLPVTVLHGRGDWMVHHAHGERLYGALRGPRKMILADNPLKLHVEMLAFYRPELFARAVLEAPGPADPENAIQPPA